MLFFSLKLLIHLEIFGLLGLIVDAKTLTLSEKKICSVNPSNSIENAFSGFRMERGFATKYSKPPLDFLSGLIFCDSGEINYQRFNKSKTKSKTDFMWDKTYCMKVDNSNNVKQKPKKKGFNHDSNTPKMNIKNLGNSKDNMEEQSRNQGEIYELYKETYDYEDYEDLEHNQLDYDRVKHKNRNPNKNDNTNRWADEIEDNNYKDRNVQKEFENTESFLTKEKASRLGFNQFLKSFKTRKYGKDSKYSKDANTIEDLTTNVEDPRKLNMLPQKFKKVNKRFDLFRKSKSRRENNSNKNKNLDWGNLKEHRSKLVKNQRVEDDFEIKTNDIFLNKREAADYGVGKQSEFREFMEDDYENDLDSEYDDFVCYKFSRRKHLSKRKILILDKNQWVGGIFRCPITWEFHQLLKQKVNQKTEKYLQPFELRCDDATAVPLVPLFTEDLREQWIQDEDEYQSKRVPFLFSPDVMIDEQNRIDMFEEHDASKNNRKPQLEIPNNWYSLLEVNEDYTFNEKELQIEKNAILNTIDYYKYIEDEEKQSSPWKQEDALQNNKAAQELNTLLQFTGLSHRIISILGNIRSHAAAQYLRHIQDIWDDVAQMIE